MNSPLAGAKTTVKMFTDIEALSTLFSIEIRVGPFSNLAVSFESNPLLGLSDSTIRANLLDRYDFASGADDTKSFTLGQDFILPFTFEVPEGVQGFMIGFEDESEVTVPPSGSFTPIPEPSTYGAIASIVLAMTVCATRRRKTRVVLPTSPACNP